MRSRKTTPKMKAYLIKLLLRIIIVGIIVIFYFTRQDDMESFLTNPGNLPFSILHIVWAIFMAIMIMHLFPRSGKLKSMASLKVKEEHHKKSKNYDELELLRYVQDQNLRAWKIMLTWLSFNAIFGTLYLFGILRARDLLLISAFFFLSDYICIIFFCPFQAFFLKNKCCINCRIYDWGHFMMFTPMLFIKSFFTWSLFFTALVVLIRWEMIYAKYPERFWEGSNDSLKCTHCFDRTCAYKYNKKDCAPHPDKGRISSRDF